MLHAIILAYLIAILVGATALLWATLRSGSAAIGAALAARRMLSGTSWHSGARTRMAQVGN